MLTTKQDLASFSGSFVEVVRHRKYAAVVASIASIKNHNSLDSIVMFTGTEKCNAPIPNMKGPLASPGYAPTDIF